MLVLVDGNSLLHRVLAVSEYTNRQPGVAGKYGGVSAFMTSLRKTIVGSDVHRCVVVFDDGLSLRRLSINPEYKQHRASRGSDPEAIERKNSFNLQMRYLCMILPMLGVTVLSLRGREGDDIIWYARSFGLGYGYTPIVIISEDMDFGQMIDNDTCMYRPVRDQYLTVNNFEVVVGIPRDRFVLMKAIKGDASDGIKGVYGAGEKTAHRIALDAPTMEFNGLRDWCLRSKDRRIKAVGENIETVFRNVELMKLGLEKFSQDELKLIGDKIHEKPRNNLQEACQMSYQFGFNSIVAQWHDWSLPFMRIGYD